MSHEAIIKIEGLKKNYKLAEDKEIQILKGINLDINSTDFCIIYGPSGSGKSTLLHHMVGLESPTEGKIKIRGTDITKLSSEDRAVFRAKKFGMVYQLWFWVKSISVWENVALPLLIAGVRESDAKIAAMKSLEEIGMADYAYKKPMQLSGGEQQRIGMARALVNDPWIIVADEPTGNLDTHSADQVMQMLQKLNVSRKRTIIMVTHNLAYLPMATKEVAMRDGQIVSGASAVKQQIREELKEVL
ncbi:MAG: ABC transporter ATP-binding protein [Patescibacteria group bacterium]